MVGEEAPEHGGELDLNAAGDISAEALVAGEHVMELLARGAVGDRRNDVEGALRALAT